MFKTLFKVKIEFILHLGAAKSINDYFKLQFNRIYDLFYIL